MRRKYLLIIPLALTAAAGCGSSSKPAATPPSSPSSTAAVSTTTKPCNLQAGGPDMILWTKTADAQPTAEVIGSVNVVKCETSAQYIQETSPTDPGDCTILVPRSADPSYNPDAVPAPRPSGAPAAMVGPGC